MVTGNGDRDPVIDHIVRHGAFAHRHAPEGAQVFHQGAGIQEGHHIHGGQRDLHGHHDMDAVDRGHRRSGQRHSLIVSLRILPINFGVLLHRT